jgi:predicted RNA binding protein YcfA (HicA-like mRNA interferase family)
MVGNSHERAAATVNTTILSVTIAGHPSVDLDPKTQSSILKQAGLK